MTPLSESEKKELMRLISAGEPLTEQWQYRLFPSAARAQESGKEYRLTYDGKLKREEVLALTPAAPWQLVREFCANRPHADGWRNLLVWGDNLLALRELLADQQGPDRFGTRGKIKLIYIDPPFATRRDFMKDKERAYRDKVLGAHFIEFLRRRLILLREILADDGSIYVHLDTKKGHYIKAVLDEVFGEENFRNEIAWRRSFAHNDPTRYGNTHDMIFYYSKTERRIWNKVFQEPSGDYVELFFDQYDPVRKERYNRLPMDAPRHGDGGNLLYEWKGVWPASGRTWAYLKAQMEEFDKQGRIHYPKSGRGKPRLKRYESEYEGTAIQDIWTDLNKIHNQSSELLNYPTQKPEVLLDRIVRTSSNKNDIVLDCFLGSGTVAAVAEKLGRRWIGMDCGKLAIYTTQKRLFSLNTSIGAAKKDERTEPQRVADFSEHLKASSSVIVVTEQARKGECEVTLHLLQDLAALVIKHDLVKKDSALSLVCPENKLLISEDRLEEPEDGPGAKLIVVDGIKFRISIITPKDKPEREQPLPAKEFALYRAGVYDMAAIKELPWVDYRPFVLKLFAVREHPHTRYGFNLDGYVGTSSAFIWNYPDYKTFTLDYGYVDDLHRVLRGKPGERFYIIAPVMAMAFAEDEMTRSDTTYVFLKVPLSILLRLIECKEPAALKQPAKEEDVNAVIDAVGFDFISQPQVVWKAKKESRKGELFADYLLEISEFRAQTLATEPEDFLNFETFSMAMVDVDYDGDVFRLSRVFWGESLIADEIKRLKTIERAKGEREAAVELKDCERLELCIAEQEFTGEQMMMILCDRYGNEKTLLLEKDDFEDNLPKATKRSAKGGGKTR